MKLTQAQHSESGPRLGPLDGYEMLERGTGFAEVFRVEPQSSEIPPAFRPIGPQSGCPGLKADGFRNMVRLHGRLGARRDLFERFGQLLWGLRVQTDSARNHQEAS